MEVLCGMETLGSTRHIVLDGESGSPRACGEGEGREFDAAFAKFLWSLVEVSNVVVTYRLCRQAALAL